jgi:hypothetical protein
MRLTLVLCIVLVSATAYGQPTTTRTVSDCRNQAQAQNLQGDTLRMYLEGCRREVRAPCRQQARARGLQGDALRQFMRSCAPQR